MTKTSAR